ncbi:MAG: hypothetical protein PUJ82_02325 [Spirochaetales bacterium]|nr:hypothetical protein [Spirochaetales bacterium]MDY5915817.1 hypothetical protein [Treponema sp.]
MKFKKIPLFGQDSSPQHTSNILALIGTLTFWLFFLICMIFIKQKPQKPKFKEIQIVLSQDFTTQKTTPTKEDKSENQKEPSKMQETQKTEEIVKPVQNEVPQIETSQVTETVTKAPETKNAVPNKTEPKTVQKTQAESKPAEQKAPENTTPKTAPITESKPVQKTESVQNAEPVEYAKSVEELMAEQMNSKKKTNDFNWDMFEDDMNEDNQDNVYTQFQNNSVETQKSTFSGEAGVAAEQNVSSIKSETVQKEKNASTQKTSSSTANALAKISNTSFKGKVENGIIGQTEVQTETNQDGHVKLKMSNGNTRALLEPTQPVINLSQNAASTIDGSRTVKIRFKVVESGNVPQNEIQITPASILTEIVKSEIIEQISKWRFEAADYIAFAEFDYKIVKQ